jgi:hypothetical protein
VLVKIHTIAAEEHARDVMASQEKPTAKPGLTAQRCTSELNGHPVVEVEVRARPRWLRCALAPHAAEVSILRPESRYHRLVFTVPEWDAFLSDVKAGRYDLVATP